MNASICYSCWRPTEFCICATSCSCWRHPSLECPRCNGQAADELDALYGHYGPTGEACAGTDWDGQPCPRRAENGSAWCDLHATPGVDRLPPQPIPIVWIEVAA